MLATLGLCWLLVAGPPLDVLTFGDAESEAAHQFVAPASDLVEGPGGAPLRRLLPLDPPDFLGTSLSFELACDPVAPTYLTARLDGSARDAAAGRLTVFCAGQQVGWQHLGEVEPLDIAADAPLAPGQYYYSTLPLPPHLTAGRTSVPITIRAMGRIWGYGQTTEEYYKRLEGPSRGIGRIFAHTEPCLELPADEPRPPAPPAPRRAEPGPELLERVRGRVDGDVRKWLAAEQPGELLRLAVLARAYHAPWAEAYQSPALVAKVVALIDDLCARFAADPNLVDTEPKWRSFGPAGYAVAALAVPLAPYLDQPLTIGGATMTRRAAWADALAASVEWRRTHRRHYTNQSMISDMNLYQSNRGLAVLDPARALPEDVARRYLHEAVGLEPWLGDWRPDGSHDRRFGDSYYQTTRRGQTRELGYVGGYGEVLDWVAKIYEASCAGGSPGDPALLDHLAAMVDARLPFRYRGVDAEGYTAMLVETFVGWRDSGPPGPVLYGQRAGWESSALQTAALLQRGPIVAAAQAQIADGQYYASLLGALGNGSTDATLTLVGVPTEYAIVSALPPADTPLPMEGPDDFVWADEQNGVVALKVGERRLYASLYWRARFGVNNLARIHDLRPDGQRLATVYLRTEFADSGLRYTFPNWLDKAFVRWQTNLPGVTDRLAMAGQQIPVALVPAGQEQPEVGVETPFVGRGLFYRLAWDDLLIGMNLTGLDNVPPQDYNLDAPPGARRLPDGQPLAGPVTVAPGTTVVLQLPR